MNVTPREAITELVHLYADAVCRRDAEQWSSLWTADGRWTLRPEHQATGRDAIVELWQRAFEAFDGYVQTVFNGGVSLDGPTTAHGRWYIGDHFRRVDGEGGLLLAHYDDTYVLDGGRWLFFSRALTPHYEGPPDLSGPFF